jgi:hypothetical protein
MALPVSDALTLSPWVIWSTIFDSWQIAFKGQSENILTSGEQKGKKSGQKKSHRLIG